MARLGFSIYPEHSTPEQDVEYIRMAGRYGFERIFTCLLSVGDRTKEEVIRDFRVRIDAAHEEGMEVMLDVSPAVFERLGISYDHLDPFVEMHANGIRLDEGFNGAQTSAMTYNRQGLKIELNASTEMGFIENVMTHHPDRKKVVACHNFYPQKYTGLGLAHFNRCNEFIKKHRLTVAAFVSSNTEGAYGPWPVNEGLCTLEMHRGLPLDFQVRHLFALGNVDDILIANAYASEEEMKACAGVNPSVLTFGLLLEKELTETEQAVLDFSEGHVVRGDMSEYMLRSTWPRVTFAKESIPAENTRDLVRGDVVILNDGYSRYKGELHIVLKDMPNDGRKNVIGRLPEYEHILLDYADPWKPFAFTVCG